MSANQILPGEPAAFEVEADLCSAAAPGFYTDRIYQILAAYAGSDRTAQLFLFKTVCLLGQPPENYPDHELDIALYLLQRWR